MKQLFFLLLVSVAATHEEVREEEISQAKVNGLGNLIIFKDMYMFAYYKPKSCTSDAECSTTSTYCDSFGKKKFCGCRPPGMKCSHDKQCCSADCVGGKCQCSMISLCKDGRKGGCCDEWKCDMRNRRLALIGYGFCQKING